MVKGARFLGPLLLGCLLLAPGGCMSFGASPLLEEARSALAERDVPGAYERARELRTRFPESEESREAFVIATRTYRWIWWKHRMEGTLDSDWVRTETPFMFEWTASRFGNDFPEEEMALMFRGMPLFFFKAFLAYGEDHPEVSRWSIVWDKDNGRMTTITGELRGASVDEASSGPAASRSGATAGNAAVR